MNPSKESRIDPPLTEAEIDEMRFQLAAWEEDWNAPGMEVYDNYPVSNLDEESRKEGKETN